MDPWTRRQSFEGRDPSRHIWERGRETLRGRVMSPWVIHYEAWLRKVTMPKQSRHLDAHIKEIDKLKKA